MSEAPVVTGRDRLRDLFRIGREEGRALLFPYMTAGLPSLDATLGMFTAMADAGADGFEVGIPYSDPLMDGPTIHEAGLKAIDAGMTMGGGIELTRTVIKETDKPTIVMSYVNPVLRMGIDRFAEAAADTGAAGVILADLPADEAAPFTAALGRVGVGLVLFVAPTTGPDRLQQIVAHDPVFIYGVAEIGVTGERTDGSTHAAAMAERVRDVTDIPLVLGVGISTPAHAAAAAAVSDGVIVGSALVRRVLDAPDPQQAADALHAAVAELAAAVRS